MSDRVLLTGITGYIGQHVGAELLNQGYEVVGTVRSRTKAEDTKTAIAAVAPVDKLTFVEADLLADEGWDEAVQGCVFAVHVASPFVGSEPKDENELITPAVEGTKRVVAAAQRAGVKRLVLTSSVASITAGKNSGRYGPDAWSDTNAKIGAYAKSKTLAEQAAWAAVAEGDMELAVINPGFVTGPALGANIDGQSVTVMTDLIAGKYPMIPDLAFGMVDVRDVARLHVKAVTAEGASGKRFIAATADPMEMAKMAAILRNAGYSKVPNRNAPNILLKIMGLFDSETRLMVPLLGKRAALDNSATFEVLGWQPTPIETSVTEMAASISL